MSTNPYVPLSTITLDSTASTVTFSSIPSSYRDLVVVFDGSTASGNYLFQTRFNGSADAIYGEQYISSAGAGSGNSNGSHTSGRFDTNRGTLTLEVLDYSALDKHKTSLSSMSFPGWSSQPQSNAFRWRSTDAINQITLLTNGGLFAAGSTVSLYGVH